MKNISRIEVNTSDFDKTKIIIELVNKVNELINKINSLNLEMDDVLLDNKEYD